MATETQHHKCPLCGPSPYNVPVVNHTLHFLISVFTCGAWAAVWFWLMIFNKQPRCGSCGRTWKGAKNEVDRAARQNRKAEHTAGKRLAIQTYNQNGPPVGTRAKVMKGNHKGKFGTVTGNDGSSVTIADKSGRAITLPLSDFNS
jgi:4'-phosphopantetheinyl transferase EntD